MHSKLFVAAAVLSVGALTVTKSAYADTLSSVSNLSNYAIQDATGETSVSGNIAYLGAIETEGSLTTTVTDAAGDLVTLSFDLLSDGGTPNNFSAVVDGVSLFSGTNIAEQDFTPETVQFTATGSDTISFVGRNDPGFLQLADVSATEVAPGASSVTPEPSSLALLGTGMLGVVGTMRRRLA